MMGIVNQGMLKKLLILKRIWKKEAISPSTEFCNSLLWTFYVKEK